MDSIDRDRGDTRVGASRRARHDQKIYGHEGDEESAPPRTRTQPLVRRPDCLRHSDLPQGCKGGVRHAVPRESVDFTPKVNRAERVQTVNRLRKGQGFRLFQRFGALDHVIDIYAAKRDRDGPLGFSKRRPDHMMDEGRAR